LFEIFVCPSSAHTSNSEISDRNGQTNSITDRASDLGIEDLTSAEFHRDFEMGGESPEKILLLGWPESGISDLAISDANTVA
jgi:hypothetical protein